MSMRKIRPHEGQHMTWQEFVQNVREGAYTDDDGHASLATTDEVSDDRLYPSEVGVFVRLGNKPKWATHVVWYNK